MSRFKKTYLWFTHERFMRRAVIIKSTGGSITIFIQDKTEQAWPSYVTLPVDPTWGKTWHQVGHHHPGRHTVLFFTCRTKTVQHHHNEIGREKKKITTPYCCYSTRYWNYLKKSCTFSQHLLPCIISRTEYVEPVSPPLDKLARPPCCLGWL